MLPELKELLEIPRWARMKNRWASLTTSDTLYSTLQKAARSKSIGEAMQLAEKWGKFVKYEKDERIKCQLQQQWDFVCLLVSCADLASKDLADNDLETAIDSALKDRPFFIYSDERMTRAQITIRALRHLPKQRVVIPIAGWDKEEAAKAAIEAEDEEKQKELGESGGFIAQFVLEAFDNGNGQITHHPADSFFPIANSTQGNKDFFASMNNAWAAAKNLAQQTGGFDGCWRLLNEGNSPMTKASGASASGAAAWGWYCALTGKAYDPRVIVLAQIDADGTLKGVIGVPAKVKAIAASNRFDTIVVANQENETQAKNALKDKGDSIRVINLSNLKSIPPAS